MDAFFGAVLAGAVPVPLYPPVRLARLEEFHVRTARLLRTCGARIVLTDSRVGRLLGQAASRARPELGVREMADLPHAGELERAARHSRFAVSLHMQIVVDALGAVLGKDGPVFGVGELPPASIAGFEVVVKRNPLEDRAREC